MTVCGTTHQKSDLVTVMAKSVHVTPALAHLVTGARAVAGYVGGAPLSIRWKCYSLSRPGTHKSPGNMPVRKNMFIHFVHTPLSPSDLPLEEAPPPTGVASHGGQWEGLEGMCVPLCAL